MEVKTCKLCGQTFPKTGEHFRIQRKDGKEYFRSLCLECERAEHRRYYAEHPEIRKAKDDKYHAANREKCLEYQRNRRASMTEEQKEKKREYDRARQRSLTEEQKERLREKGRRYYYSEKGQATKRKYREEHADEQNAKALARYYADKDKARERKKRWKEENQEKYREERRRYREKHKDEINAKRRASASWEKEKERAREYRREHPDADRNHCHVRRARMRGLEATFTVEQWELAQIEFGKRCAYCGREMKLSRDHVIPLISGGTYTKDNIVPACKRCNSSKAARPFSEWYRAQPFYNEEREKHVLEYIGKEIAV